jgi:hypothetical protein
MSKRRILQAYTAGDLDNAFTLLNLQMVFEALDRSHKCFICSQRKHLECAFCRIGEGVLTFEYKNK